MIEDEGQTNASGVSPAVSYYDYAANERSTMGILKVLLGAIIRKHDRRRGSDERLRR